MDALAALRAEIARKKQAKEAVQTQLTTAGGTAEETKSTKRYIRNGDIEALLTGKLQGAGTDVPATAEAMSDVAPKATHEQSTELTTASDRTKSSVMHAALPVPDAYRILSRSEVIKRLRKLNLVATYFGETDLQRCRRLWEYTTTHVLEKEDLAVKGGFESHVKSSDGPILGDNAVPSLARIAEAIEHSDASGPPAAKRPRKDADGTMATFDSHRDDDAASRGSKDKTRTVSADAKPYRDKDENKYVYKYFKGLLNEWEDEFLSKPDNYRGSSAGKNELYLLNQSKDFLRPFFRMCKHKALPTDLKKLLKEIVQCCEDREYSKAGDAYIRMAIGNAAWPIGVTAVGLHERAAREKVAEGKQAHVMHDEETRKYVTIIKRLMAWAQQKYPTDPSRSLYS